MLTNEIIMWMSFVRHNYNNVSVLFRISIHYHRQLFKFPLYVYTPSLPSLNLSTHTQLHTYLYVLFTCVLHHFSSYSYWTLPTTWLHMPYSNIYTTFSTAHATELKKLSIRRHICYFVHHTCGIHWREQPRHRRAHPRYHSHCS